jgi:phosphoribosylaminoimidazole (AIR) synthetase
LHAPLIAALACLSPHPHKEAEKILAAIDATGEPCWLIGDVHAREDEAIHLDNFTQAFS